MKPIAEWHDVDAATFKEKIAALNQPAVLRGHVANWPAVKAALQSNDAFCKYIAPMDRQVPAEMFLGAPAIQGKFWYGPKMHGFNFERKPEQLSNALKLLLKHLDDPAPPSIYVGSVQIRQSMPQFGNENSISFLDQSIQPRIWIGNNVTVQTHYDHSENLACVVSGKRRFTLFPPDQLKNLYVGPLDFTIAGQPISMVRLEDPDFEKYPKFKHALDEAYSAELLPGDAIYVPYMWWHHVESLAPFNVLVNYWWDPALPGTGAAFFALMHAVMSVRHLPPDKREVWRAYFEHYVFEDNGDPTAHLEQWEKGVLQDMSPELASHMKHWLIQGLTR